VWKPTAKSFEPFLHPRYRLEDEAMALERRTGNVDPIQHVYRRRAGVSMESVG
jgi:hypothetical protein